MLQHGMDFHSLVALRREHPTWGLLAADHAPLVISVLYRQFVLPNARSLPRDNLVTSLDDELFRLREQLSANQFPRSASDYLDDWASDEKGWLRKYYPPGS